MFNVMWGSIRLFFIGILKRAYFWVPTILLDPFDLYNQYIKQFLPTRYPQNIKMPPKLGLLVFILMIFVAAIMTYHELRMSRLQEFYKYSPEAHKDRIFRIFYELLKEGKFLKNANTDRRQKWDEEIFKEFNNYCTSAFNCNYLLKTGRRHNSFTPLQDNNYDNALEFLESFLDKEFNSFSLKT